MQRKSVIIQADALAALKARLELQPAYEKQAFTLREAIGELVPVIEDLRAKGYPLSVIAQMLSEGNLQVSAGTLADYLRQFAKASGPRRKGGTKRKAPAAAPAPAPSLPPQPTGGPAVANAVREEALRRILDDDFPPPAGAEG